MDVQKHGDQIKMKVRRRKPDPGQRRSEFAVHIAEPTVTSALTRSIDVPVHPEEPWTNSSMLQCGSTNLVDVSNQSHAEVNADNWVEHHRA